MQPGARIGVCGQPHSRPYMLMTATSSTVHNDSIQPVVGTFQLIAHIGSVNVGPLSA